MTFSVAFIYLLLVFVSVSSSPANQAERQSKASECRVDYGSQPVLLVSLDGFRADYLQRGVTPTLQQLSLDGVHAPFMKPSYPSVTFPNHYTIVTGLYPESHGIIANSFYDPEFFASFYMGLNESRWWGGEPIWNTLTRQGKLSATYYWPGSDINIGGQYPTYWMPYNDTMPYEERVRQVLEWLDLPVLQRPDWLSLYFSQPDSAGHSYGPNSPQVDAELGVMDGIIQLLVDGLLTRGILGCVNLLVVADHGMAQGGPGSVIKLADYVPDIYNKAFTYTGAFTRINPKNSSLEVKYEMMQNLSCQRPEMRTYERENLPTRFHFSNNRRIEPIVMDLDEGFSCSVTSSYYNNGNHGYDNYFPSMNALFLAYGPAFKQGLEVESFQNLELYNLMCHLLGVEPAPNNGTVGSLSKILVNPPQDPTTLMESPPPKGQYPEDSALILDRLDDSQCSGNLVQPEPWLSSLNLTTEAQQLAEATHAPWGLPYSGNLTADLLLLYHQDHVTAYSQSLKIPLYTAFSVPAEGSLPVGTPVSQWSSDVRLDTGNTATCTSYSQNNVLMHPLFPPSFSTNSTLDRVPFLVSNAVPTTVQLAQHWTDLLSLIPAWVSTYGGLNVLLGPVFDNNADSFPDDFSTIVNLATPSDLFAVVTRCQSIVTSIDLCPLDQLDALSFIFPENQAITNCLGASRYAQEFSAKVNDVQTATGLWLYPTLAYQDRLALTLRIQSDLWS